MIVEAAAQYGLCGGKVIWYKACTAKMHPYKYGFGGVSKQLNYICCSLMDPLSPLEVMSELDFTTLWGWIKEKLILWSRICFMLTWGGQHIVPKGFEIPLWAVSAIIFWCDCHHKLSVHVTPHEGKWLLTSGIWIWSLLLSPSSSLNAWKTFWYLYFHERDNEGC